METLRKTHSETVRNNNEQYLVSTYNSTENYVLLLVLLCIWV